MRTHQHYSRLPFHKHLIRATFTALLGLAAVLAIPSFTACQRAPVERTATERQQDEKLAQEVKASFGNSPSFKFPDVEVAAYKGTIQLSGFVVSDEQKSTAEELAKGVSGVKSVENKISLKK